MGKTMDKKGIIEVVKQYISDDINSGALMIAGEWGSGKTFLYQNELMNTIKDAAVGRNKRIKEVNLSLYGVDSIEMLSKEILFHILGKNHMWGNHAEIVDGLFGLVSKSVAIGIHGITIDFKELYLWLKGIRIKNIVLCLDDFERCTIPVADLLGFVNTLVEKYGYKVIILSDENKIGKLHANKNLELKYIATLLSMQNESDNNNINMEERIKDKNSVLFSENVYYEFAKEKVISRIVHYTPNKREMLQNLINSLPEEKNLTTTVSYKSFLSKKLEYIEKQLCKYDTCNYRLIKTWLQRYKKIYCACREVFEKNENYEDLTVELMQHSLRCILDPGCSHLEEYDESWYITENGYAREDAVAYPFVERWMQDLEWNQESVVQICKKRLRAIACSKRSSRQGATLAQLIDWRYETDDEIKTKIVRLVNETKQDEYTWGRYPRIIHDMLFFNGLNNRICSEKQIEEVVSHMKENIEKASKSEIEDPEFQMRVLYSFKTEEERKKFYYYYQQLIACIENKLVELNYNYSNKEGGKWTPQSFSSMCQQRVDYFQRRNAFLSIIGYEKVLSLINEADLREKEMILQALRLIYRFESNQDVYPQDEEGLKNLCNCIRKKGFGNDVAQIDSQKRYLETLDRIIAQY